jgi:hypothetical protein
MDRYFFHMVSDQRFEDVVGVNLLTLESARDHAAEALAELLKDSSSQFWKTRPWVMTVTDADGHAFFTIGIDGEAPIASRA